MTARQNGFAVIFWIFYAFFGKNEADNTSLLEIKMKNCPLTKNILSTLTERFKTRFFVHVTSDCNRTAMDHGNFSVTLHFTYLFLLSTNVNTWHNKYFLSKIKEEQTMY